MSVKLGDTIKRLREAKQLSKEDFAKKIKKSVNYIYLLENNKRTPRVSGLERIAEALEMKISEIFKDAEDSK